MRENAMDEEVKPSIWVSPTGEEPIVEVLGQVFWLLCEMLGASIERATRFLG